MKLRYREMKAFSAVYTYYFWKWTLEILVPSLYFIFYSFILSTISLYLPMHRKWGFFFHCIYFFYIFING